MSRTNTARAKVILFKSKTLKGGAHPVMLNRGMNFTDMAKLTWDKVGRERLMYTRNRALKHLEPDTFSIKITDEISLILSYLKNYKDTFQNYVFPIIDGSYSEEEILKKINNKTSNINDHLKQIGKVLGIEQKTTAYVSCHTYTTTLLNNDAPYMLSKRS